MGLISWMLLTFAVNGGEVAAPNYNFQEVGFHINQTLIELEKKKKEEWR